MIESVHCPECQTHYGLRRERVRYGLRRARCFRCEGIFSIEDEVNHILAAGLPQESTALPFLAENFRYSPAALELATVEPPTIESIHLDASALESVYQQPPVFEDEPFEPAFLPEPLVESPEPVEFEELPLAMPDSLTLHDLEGAEEEILDKTLVDYHPPTTPRALPPMVAVPAEAITTAGGGGYSSARDAINKLLGGMGAPPEPAAPSSTRSRGPMDLEATLSALDETLGGNKIFPSASAAARPAELPVMDFDASLLAINEPTAPLLPEASPATVRLSREDILAAMGPTPEPMQTMGMTIKNFPESRPEADAPMVMLTPPPIFSTTPPPPPPPITVPTSFMPLEESPDQNLFRVQAGTETLSGLTMDQMTDLVLQGRLADYNMVARQFSENWIEAGKVPALRAVFERFRRERMAAEPPPAHAVEAEVPKRSLFGGLFGRKES